MEANITYTDPNLDGGTFSGHRVVLNQQSPWRFTEVGWVKYSGLGLANFVSYDDGIVGPRTEFFWGLSPTTHLYSSQYDPNTNLHWFYLDSVPFFSRDMNFTSGDRVAGGGEVLDGVESMGLTLLSGLGYSVNQGGNFSYLPWDGYQRYVEDYPYCNMPSGANSFYDADCPYRVFLPLILK